MTLLILGVTFIFATLKFQHMLMRHDPVINTYVEEDGLQDMVFDTKNSDFQIAVGLGKYLTNIVYNDPHYLHWIASFYIAGRDENDPESKKVKMHPCTTEDYAKFFPTAAPFRNEIDNLRQQGGLFCLDWQKEGVELFGSNN